MNRFATRPRWTLAVSALVALIVALVAAHFSSHDPHAPSIAGNLFLTTDWVVMECLDILLNKLALSQYFNGDYNKEFTRKYATGESVRVKLPQRFLIRDGWGYQPQAINRQYTTVNVNQPFGIDFEWDTYERAVKMERSEAELKKNYLEPAMAQLFQEIETRAAKWAYQNASMIVGVLGTDPVDFDSSTASARTKLVQNGCPEGKDRGALLPPTVMQALKKSALAYLNPQMDISKQYRTGIVGKADGFDVYESMSLFTHTAGTWAGSVTVNGAGQSGSTLTITATAGDTFKAGDKFSMANVNPTNPSTRRRFGTSAKTFTVMQDLTAAGGGVDVLTISPAIYGPGSQYQNVDALPANAAALTLFPGTSSPNGKTGQVGLAIHPDAFALVGLELENPDKEEYASQFRDSDSGIPLAFIRAFDAKDRKWINRFDTFIGFGNLYPDNCAVAILCG